MEDNTAEQFNEMTAALEVEKQYDERVQKALMVAHVVQLAGGIYKVARKRGLPRKAAADLAQKYFDYEMYPPIYIETGEVL